MIYYKTLLKGAVINNKESCPTFCQVSKITAVKTNIARGILDVSNTLSGDIFAGEMQSITVDIFAGVSVTMVCGLAWMTICTD